MANNRDNIEVLEGGDSQPEPGGVTPFNQKESHRPRFEMQNANEIDNSDIRGIEQNEYMIAGIYEPEFGMDMDEKETNRILKIFQDRTLRKALIEKRRDLKERNDMKMD